MKSLTRTITSSKIPPELWLKIFGYATEVLGLLAADAYESSDLPQSTVNKDQQYSLRVALITKCSLVQVCRLWRVLASEFLYESVIISRVEALPSLCETLGRSPSADANPLGWWTKRLDVVIQTQRCEYVDYRMLAEVIRHLPNLVVAILSVPMLPLTDCWVRQLPSVVITSLIETCRSLQVLDCSDSILRPCREDLMTLVAAAPLLRALRCPICSPPLEKAQGRLDLPVLSKLTSVELMSVFLLDYLPKNREHNHFPALRKLTYDCIPPPFYDRAWRDFVRLSCANVSTVHIDFCLQGESLQKEMDLLTESCPSLKRLVVFFRSYAELKKNLVIPPVSYLGLYCKTPTAPSAHYRNLFAALCTLTGSGLEVIRLLRRSTVKEMKCQYPLLLRDGLAKVSSCHFRVEDDSGRLLSTSEALHSLELVGDS